MRKGKLFVIAGPSGAGKRTMISDILKEKELNIVVSVSFTTRQKRPGETDGVEYSFISKEEFKAKIANDEMLEYSEHFNNFYGTSKAWVESRLNVGINVILEIETEGFRQIKAKFPELVSIFILPPNMEVLEKRLRGRGTEDEDDIRLRIEKAKIEMQDAHLFSYQIVNDVISEAAAELKKIITNAL